jgi:ABC-type dipeptide/oligopeptide/nickel transport system permease component
MKCVIFIVFLFVRYILCDVYNNIYSEYKGESFPAQFLQIDKANISLDDLDQYINYIHMSLNYFGTYLNGKYINDTDVNTAIGVFLTKCKYKYFKPSLIKLKYV